MLPLYTKPPERNLVYWREADTSSSNPTQNSSAVLFLFGHSSHSSRNYNIIRQSITKFNQSLTNVFLPSESVRLLL